jgi:hypothetical protein
LSETDLHAATQIRRGIGVGNPFRAEFTVWLSP